MRRRVLLFCLSAIALFTNAQVSAESPDKVQLGQALFFDTNLSLTRKQACGTCHEPGRAFSDGRANDVGGAASLGDDGVSLGDRNAPAITYASRIPAFHIDANGDYVGGFFLDGRSSTMNDQASEPFTNPLEMAMPDRASIVERVRENPGYVASLQSLFGSDVFVNDEIAFKFVIESIVAFETSDLFSAFDSKYDRYLRGEYEMTTEEEVGRLLFFSQMIGCHNCHLSDTRETASNELFTNHKYHNIGVPVNESVRAKNEVTEIDHGLLANPVVTDSAYDGKFRVPSLRNVAVTGPYMHNGVFKELETAVLFYDKYLVSNRNSATNPETGEPWGEPEVASTVDLDLLQQGQPITEERASALAAFLRTLTDRRYETLLE